MRVPYSWLKEYLTSVPELPKRCHLLTMGGLEVEDVRDCTATDGGSSNKILMTAATPNRGDLLSMVGVERLAMLRHGIDDIRLFYSGDMRFLEQF